MEGFPGDRDIDGVANPLDIDDGDRILDNFEGSPAVGRGSAGGTQTAQTSNEFVLASGMNLNLGTR